jgi:predicted O-methyltransferase YrrM
LEVGTYTGYSAICLSEGLTTGGQLHTIEKNEELRPIAERFFEKAGVKDSITMHIGDATEVLVDLDEKFDLAFIDADKSNYINYYELILPKLKQGGFIVADNVLWSGKVLQESEMEKDVDARTLDQFNKMILNDERVENVLLPIRDGLMIIRKK